MQMLGWPARQSQSTEIDEDAVVARPDPTDDAAPIDDRVGENRLMADGADEARDVATLRSWLRRTAGAHHSVDAALDQQIRELVRRVVWEWRKFSWTRLGETVHAAASALVGVALVMCAMAFLTVAAPEVLGFSVVVASSGAMRPAIQTGDLVILRQAGAGGGIAVGDVVGLRVAGSSRLALRRVIAEPQVDGRSYLQTRADANASPDPILHASSEVADIVIMTVPRFGWLLGSMTTSPVGYVLVWLPIAWLAGPEIREFLRATRWGIVPIGGRFEPRMLDARSEKLRLGADALRARLNGESQGLRARLRRASKRTRPVQVLPG